MKKPVKPTGQTIRLRSIPHNLWKAGPQAHFPEKGQDWLSAWQCCNVPRLWNGARVAHLHLTPTTARLACWQSPLTIDGHPALQCISRGSVIPYTSLEGCCLIKSNTSWFKARAIDTCSSRQQKAAMQPSPWTALMMEATRNSSCWKCSCCVHPCWSEQPELHVQQHHPWQITG